MSAQPEPEDTTMTTTIPPVAGSRAPIELPRPAKTASALTTTLGIARRTVLRSVRTPQVFVIGMIQGAMFLLIFRYVFGGAIPINGIPYVNFLVPGFVGTGVLFSGMTASIGAAEDLTDGLFDRLRSLPVPRLAVVSGRVVADTALGAIGLTVTTAVGFAVGFRTSAAVLSLLAAFALCVMAAFAFTWMFVWLGITAGTPQAAQSIGLLVFPFTFVSSAFVPVESMPGWMQGFARNQPLTQIVNATRAFTLGDKAQAVLGHPASYFAIRSLLWCLLFVVIFAPLAARKYQKG
ncbi:MAG: type transport system permease protein [Actinomycetota bacterium]|jgi:ABC transporter DrrB family efflux protein|nr:type transport system permease protein [Actinomycetota bacterium]